MMLSADNNVNNAARYCEYSLVEFVDRNPENSIFLSLDLIAVCI